MAMTPLFSVSDVASSVPFDNSTNGFIATDVQDAIEEATHKLVHYEVSATASALAPTGTNTLINSMTISPAAGTYIVWFDCDINSGSAGAAITCSIYVGGVQDVSSVRKIVPFSGGTLTSGSARGIMALHCTVVVTSGQAVEIRWSSSNSGPTAAARTLTLLRIL